MPYVNWACGTSHSPTPLEVSTLPHATPVNPRRVLTKPSRPVYNNGYDNEDHDYILYAGDWLGTDNGHK